MYPVIRMKFEPKVLMWIAISSKVFHLHIFNQTSLFQSILTCISMNACPNWSILSMKNMRATKQSSGPCTLSLCGKKHKSGSEIKRSNLYRKMTTHQMFHRHDQLEDFRQYSYLKLMKRIGKHRATSN